MVVKRPLFGEGNNSTSRSPPNSHPRIGRNPVGQADSLTIDPVGIPERRVAQIRRRTRTANTPLQSPSKTTHCRSPAEKNHRKPSCQRGRQRRSLAPHVLGPLEAPRICWLRRGPAGRPSRQPPGRRFCLHVGRPEAPQIHPTLGTSCFHRRPEPHTSRPWSPPHLQRCRRSADVQVDRGTSRRTTGRTNPHD